MASRSATARRDTANIERADGPLYVYAIIPRSEKMVSTTGLDGSVLSAIRHGEVAAVVGPAGAGRIRPSRANVLAHEQVVTALHTRGAVLPVRFGTVMPDGATVVEELLEPRAGEYAARLHRLAGMDAYRLKARYLPDVALRDAVGRNASIRRMRARMEARGSRATQQEQLEMGKLVMDELERLRQDDAAGLLRRLGPVVDAVEVKETRSDDVALSAALLVDRQQVATLEDVLEEIALEQQERLRLELVGPLPAWDFADGGVGAD